MKKPKITEGGWENYEDSIRVFQNPESRGYIEICKIEQDWGDSRANAKAISAVPESHDQLIKYRDLLKECLKHGFDSESIENEIKELESVMLKAGFTE